MRINGQGSHLSLSQVGRIRHPAKRGFDGHRICAKLRKGKLMSRRINGIRERKVIRLCIACKIDTSIATHCHADERNLLQRDWIQKCRKKKRLPIWRKL